LIENEARVLKDEVKRLTLDQNHHKERIKDNQEKIKLNKQLPYLIGNIVEILDINPEVRFVFCVDVFDTCGRMLLVPLPGLRWGGREVKCSPECEAVAINLRGLGARKLQIVFVIGLAQPDCICVRHDVTPPVQLTASASPAGSLNDGTRDVGRDHVF
jgi:hypothetical protein